MFRKNHTIVNFEGLLTIISFQPIVKSLKILVGHGFQGIPHFVPGNVHC